MWFSRYHFLVFAMLSAGIALGQFRGGPSDGYGTGRLTQVTCTSAAAAFSFRGGIGDGAASNTLSQSNCAPVQAALGYIGGMSDGASSQLLAQSNCPSLEGALGYKGGTSDGHAAQVLTQSICAPAEGSLGYQGGSSDGSASNGLTQSICSPSDANPAFFGTVGDGFMANTLVQSECAPQLPVSAFLSNGGDAFDFNLLQQTICPGTTPLPVELIAFSANCGDDEVFLEWSTGSEQNNERFTIERSADNLEWTPVGTLAGAGNSMSVIHYSFSDEAPLNGLAYYRLEQKDLDGSTELSDVVVVNCRSGDGLVPVLYPNPTRDDITLELPGAAEPLRYDVVNAWGAVVGSGTVMERTVVHAAHLASGVYLLRLYPSDPEAEGHYQDIRFVKN